MHEEMFTASGERIMRLTFGCASETVLSALVLCMGVCFE